MAAKRLKVIAIWGFLHFAVTHGTLFLLSSILDYITAILATILIAELFAGFAGYKGVMALLSTPGTEKENQLTIIGVGASVAFFSSLLSGALTYFLDGQFIFGGGAGWYTLVAAAIGGYIAGRKSGSNSKFFGR